MTRRPSTTIIHPDQRSFFDAQPVSLAGFGMKLRDALSDTLASVRERKGMDRYDVAAEIGRIDPDREVSKHMLDRYCAPSADEWRLPAELIPVLYKVTEDPCILNLIVEACDHKAIPTEAAALGELMLYEMEERKIREKKELIKKQLSSDALDWAEKEINRRSRS